MKRTLLMPFLLMALLLASCSKDDPQSVSITADVQELPRTGGPVTLSIKANCDWTLSGYRKEAGSGDKTITCNVARNAGYDILTHTFTLTSSDGTSKSSAYVKQDSRKGLEIGFTIKEVPAEGGDFSVDINTNDEVEVTDCPDWMTFVSSRALKKYKYTFNAKANETGMARHGIVELNGKETKGRFIVEQPPLELTSVKFSRKPDLLYTGQEVTLGILPEPEFADLSGLSVKAHCGENNISCTLLNREITFKTHIAGMYTFDFYNGKKLLHTDSIKVLKGDINITLNHPGTCLVGDILEVGLDVPADGCTLDVLCAPGVLEMLDDGRYAVRKEGSITFVATNTLTGREDRETVNAVLVKSMSWIECRPSILEDNLIATFYTELVSNSMIYFSSFSIFGPDGHLILSDSGSVTARNGYLLIKSNEFPTSAGEHTVWVEVVVDGETRYVTSQASAY